MESMASTGMMFELDQGKPPNLADMVFKQPIIEVTRPSQLANPIERLIKYDFRERRMIEWKSLHEQKELAQFQQKLHRLIDSQ